MARKNQEVMNKCLGEAVLGFGGSAPERIDQDTAVPILKKEL
jgi:hypothetical protein